MTQGARANAVPTEDEIAAWLTNTHGQGETRANAWARFLLGLPWRYIRPLVQITINSHQPHPKPVLVEAARASTSRSFRAAAKRHLAQQEALR